MNFDKIRSLHGRKSEEEFLRRNVIIYNMYYYNGHHSLSGYLFLIEQTFLRLYLPPPRYPTLIVRLPSTAS